MKPHTKRLLLWLSGKCRAWSYDLCDLSSRLALRACPPEPWVPRSPVDKLLHDVLLAYYKDVVESPTYLFDRVSGAKNFEHVKGLQWKYKSWSTSEHD